MRSNVCVRFFSLTRKLARALSGRDARLAQSTDDTAMAEGMWHVLCRTRRRDNVPMRKLHDSLAEHMAGILALGAHRPPTGRIEALNNNWETLVRRARGYRKSRVPARKAAIHHREPQSPTTRASVAFLRSD